MPTTPFESVGRLAGEFDNCAIATKIIPVGTTIQYGEKRFELSNTILEGHRFAIEPIKKGAFLKSWAFPFGTATQDIETGAYLCNEAMLKELGSRSLEFPLPSSPNFEDEIPPFVFNQDQFKAGSSSPIYQSDNHFLGFQRSGNRGVGTRNFIVILSTSATNSGFVHFLEKRVKTQVNLPDSVAGIVSVVHTEGNSADANNDALFLRTLAGFIVHPNIGAVLIVDDGKGNNERLLSFMHKHNYPVSDVPHQFLTVDGNFGSCLTEATAVIQQWLQQLGQMKRTPQPLRHLKIALQCGGSDAFSGISGNPVASWVARELINYQGSANLAETDELVGAEAYVLDNVRDKKTALRFLEVVERFKKWAERHGHSVKANPSGGNLYRGLYNIYLKSLGAATKRHPDVTLDHIIDYSQQMDAPGFYFMDSPGNDLESIAGQVGSGCNLIFFVTGNGSITNFPFVPTIKIVTTSERFSLLENDMDVNAGAYLDGTPMDIVGQQTFDLMQEVSSGQLTAGEKAGHSQVQIWRDWPLSQRMTGQNPAIQSVVKRPLNFSTPPKTSSQLLEIQKPVQKLNLILPTSLCSGQIARMCAEQFNKNGLGKEYGISQTVALPHTEGCGSPTVTEFINTIIGYATHPHVRHCLLLEHGCEKTHNAFWRNQFKEAELDPTEFGWASIQMDGGIEAVFKKIEGWFSDELTTEKSPEKMKANTAPVRLGLISENGADDKTAVSLAKLSQQILSSNGQLIVSANDKLLDNTAFLTQIGLKPLTSPNLHFAEHPKSAGLYLMNRPSTHWIETISGLGATGVDLILGVVERPLPGHPFIPVLQSSTTLTELDFTVSDGEQNVAQLISLIQSTLNGTYTAVADQQENRAFQITRGALGISL